MPQMEMGLSALLCPTPLLGSVQLGSPSHNGWHLQEVGWAPQERPQSCHWLRLCSVKVVAQALSSLESLSHPGSPAWHLQVPTLGALSTGLGVGWAFQWPWDLNSAVLDEARPGESPALWLSSLPHSTTPWSESQPHCQQDTGGKEGGKHVFCYLCLQTHKQRVRTALGGTPGIKETRRHHPAHRSTQFLEHPPTQCFSQHHTRRRIPVWVSIKSIEIREIIQEEIII